MLNDLEIAQAARPKPIAEIAAALGLGDDDIELFGRYKAKIPLVAEAGRSSLLDRLPDRPAAKYIHVTGLTPTPQGEGKSTTAIGLAMALHRLGHRAIVCLRQPSLGPVFGRKGGATGGGRAQVVPMEDMNLHLTGDSHAIGAAHNLLAALLDHSLLEGNPLRLDPAGITWPRAIDLNDRALRRIAVGLGESAVGYPRETRFENTATSEVTAILCLSTNLADWRQRLGRIIVGFDLDGAPVTAEHLGAAGAMAALLKDAVKPNLLQTIEHTPCLVHGTAWAHLGVGTSSVLADRVALKLADYVVTESGFGADLGLEKFADVKCRASGLRPHAVALVATLRALKMHGGLGNGLAAIRRGAANLQKQIENARLFGLPVVVAVNRFQADSASELEAVRQIALDAGAREAVISEAWAKGSAGAEALAEAVVRSAADTRADDFRFLYPLDWTARRKIETIATQVYGARQVAYSPEAEADLERCAALGGDGLPVCIVKTQHSLSHDPALKGRPTSFTFPVREARLMAGAGYLWAAAEAIQTLPALPRDPAARHFDVDPAGRIVWPPNR